MGLEKKKKRRVISTHNGHDHRNKVFNTISLTA